MHRRPCSGCGGQLQGVLSAGSHLRRQHPGGTCTEPSYCLSHIPMWAGSGSRPAAPPPCRCTRQSPGRARTNWCTLRSARRRRAAPTACGGAGRREGRALLSINKSVCAACTGHTRATASTAACRSLASNAGRWSRTGWGGAGWSAAGQSMRDSAGPSSNARRAKACRLPCRPPANQLANSHSLLVWDYVFADGPPLAAVPHLYPPGSRRAAAGQPQGRLGI
mgnify:CR=1 FL=1